MHSLPSLQYLRSRTTTHTNMESVTQTSATKRFSTMVGMVLWDISPLKSEQFNSFINTTTRNAQPIITRQYRVAPFLWIQFWFYWNHLMDCLNNYSLKITGTPSIHHHRKKLILCEVIKIPTLSMDSISANSKTNILKKSGAPGQATPNRLTI